ncbi:MAG: hypothetical protein KME30_18945 [Iphinoe sp. HA4291-MV1]|jgi:magnesium-transporting ATPase (P-type)|nr:hypothetical protein [Iphinoe sp. HA4291-MV1]
MSRLFRGITVVLTAIGVVVILLQEAELLKDLIASTQLSFSENPFGFALAQNFTLIAIIKKTILLLIASAVEIALVWLLVLLNIISQRRGLIATLVLFILVGITIFIVYRFLPLPF